MLVNKKKVDVVILTYKSCDFLYFNIEKLFIQTYHVSKIIFMNTDKEKFLCNFSKKEYKDKIFEYINKGKIELHNISKENFNHGKTRNEALYYVDSDYVLFMTDDCIAVDSDLIKNLVEGFSINNTAISFARQIPKNDANIIEKDIREFNYPSYDIIKDKNTEKKYGIKNYFISNVCAMYDVNIFKNLSMFDENVILNEDMFYCFKAINKGYKVVYKSNAKVYHSHNYTNKEQFSRNFDIGVSQKMKKELFMNISSTSEGLLLLKTLAIKYILKFRFITLFKLIMNCAYRYFGYKMGYNYEKLSFDDCRKYAMNKNFFK